MVYIVNEEIFYIMKEKNTSSKILCSDDLYNFVFKEYSGNIDTSILSHLFI